MISVIIPCYNRRECVLALLRDIHLQVAGTFEVIVVDDCSSDDSVKAVREQFPEVKLLINEKNGGPCVSRNRGIVEARGEIIVGFDSDVTVPDTRFLAKVEQLFAQCSENDGFCFRLLKPDGKTEDTPRWWHPVKIEQFANCEFVSCYFSGTAYAFRKKHLISAGLFPEIYYMHMEEAELAWRLVDQKTRILHRPELAVIHHANPVSLRSEIKVFYKPRNHILIAIRCMPLLKGIYYVLPRMVYALGKAFKGGHLNRLLAAWFSAARLAPRGFRERRKIPYPTWSQMKALEKQ
jgi:GT2 family glycosyltransferase